MATGAAAFRVVREQNRRESARRPVACFVDLDHIVRRGTHGASVWSILGRAVRHGPLVAYTEHRYTDALCVLRDLGGTTASAIIGEGGATLHTGPDLNDDQAWRDHVMAGWDAVEIAHRVQTLPGLTINDAACDIGLWRVRVSRTRSGQRLTAAQVSNFLRDRGLKATAHRWSRDELLVAPMYADPVAAADYLTLCLGVSAHDVLAIAPARTARAWRSVAARIIAVPSDDSAAPPADGQLTQTLAQGAAGALEGLDRLGLSTAVLAA